ncbi:MAG TPA: hypothetical protein DCQ06_05435, partial [Myxococcales bacterium]|nr:hypothetical protein [Myxococcales bacterium]
MGGRLDPARLHLDAVHMEQAIEIAVHYGARPQLAVAFVYLRSQGGGDFFADVPFAWSAGELRADGVKADVFELRYERGQDSYNRLLDADLAERFARGKYGLVVVEACWDDRMFQLAQSVGALLCETAPAAAHPTRCVDFR